jgi:hypothetical protein
MTTFRAGDCIVWKTYCGQVCGPATVESIYPGVNNDWLCVTTESIRGLWVKSGEVFRVNGNPISRKETRDESLASRV